MSDRGRGNKGRGGRGRGRGRGAGRGQRNVSESLGAMRLDERPTTAPSRSHQPSPPDSSPEKRSRTPEREALQAPPSSVLQTTPSPPSSSVLQTTPSPPSSGLQTTPSPPSSSSGGSPGATYSPEVVSLPPVSHESVGNGDFHFGSSIGGSSHQSRALFPPPRPATGYGTRGRKIALKLNFFEMKLPTQSIINQYRVDITQDRDHGDERVVIQKHVCLSVWQALLKKYAEELKGKFPVYDGRSTLYAKELLWGGARTFKIDWEDSEDGDRKRTHSVHISHTGSVDLSLLQKFINRKKPYETATTRQNEFDSGRSAIQAIEVILSQLPKSLYNTIGRSHYFDPGRNQVSLGQGCDIWEGYYQSIRPGQWKPFVNLDVTFTAIMQDINLVKFICELSGCKYPGDALRGRNLGEVKSQLCGLKVSTNHMGYKRVYKLNNDKRKVLGKSARDFQFQLGDGVFTSVERYYQEKYKIRLEFPGLNMVVVGSRGTTQLPMELCTIVRGQHRKGKLTADQTSEMIRSAAKPAHERMHRIEEIAKKELFSTPLMEYYGIDVDNRMYETSARVLEPPIITYSNKEELTPRNGTWNLQGVQFYSGMKLDNWVIIDFVEVREDNLYKFLDELRGVGRNSGIFISEPRAVVSPRINPRDDEFRKIGAIRQEFESMHKKYNPVMFMVFLNEKKPFPLPNKDMYRHVKSICDYELGVLSQCIKDKNVFKSNTSTIANICLKINAKLGGINHIIDRSTTSFAENFADLFKKPIMFIGADVNHPHVGMDEVMPSIAAAVGSIESKLAKYVSSVRFQKHSRTVEKKEQEPGLPKRKERLEMIDKFDDMCYELISAFRENCRGKLPERIIYYRDGVSEGQFREVLNRELTSMRRACGRFSADYQPAITIVCVQKRHHLRMFCKDRRDAVGKGNNVPPGCVLDSDVTHPVEFDFYLCSHFGLQGTSRPTHYHVLWDENDFNSNSLQALTYHLCHLYARCTKAVSIPAPVYYAHWVAFRAMMSTNFEDDTSSVRSGGSGGSGEAVNWDEKRKPLLIRNGLMYWA